MKYKTKNRLVMISTVVAIVLMLSTVFVGAFVISPAVEAKNYNEGLATALKTNDAAERELAAKCLSAVEAAGIEVLDPGFIASDCDGKYHTRYYFLSEAGVEWVPTVYSEKPSGWHFNEKAWAFVA